jgi:hypothetical protein
MAPMMATSWINSSARRTVKSRRATSASVARSLWLLAMLFANSFSQALEAWTGPNCDE